MSVSFKLRTQKRDGLAPLYARIQAPSLEVNLLLSTHIEVDIEKWSLPHASDDFKEYLNTPEGMRAKELTKEIKRSVDSLLRQNIKVSTGMIEKLIDSIVYHEERLQAERNQGFITLNQYIHNFIKDAESGKRQTEKGTNYAAGSIKCKRTTMRQFINFQGYAKRTIDFGDIDMAFYYEYTAYLKSKNYSVNSIGKCIKELKTMLRSAESEGYNVNPRYKDKKFKGVRIDVDSIYLTKDDLDKIMKADISMYGVGHQQARDIFMVGVWTAQRVSDYNYISKENMKRHSITKTINGSLISKEFMTIEIHQRKTGCKVSIPISSELHKILKRYNYELPHLEEQVINRYMKDICKLAGLNELIEIQSTKGGILKKEFKHKWELVHTHTARRTGATLMYLAGMDYYDIMRITGHTSPTMLKKYIKVDSLEVADKITDKYTYFD